LTLSAPALLRAWHATLPALWRSNTADALYVATDPLIFGSRVQINAMAQNERIATIYGSREYVDAGALMSYGPNWTDLFRHAADLVEKYCVGRSQPIFLLSNRQNLI
jgi:ABC-type uncharacterized transport system substrate-binding protein